MISFPDKSELVPTVKYLTPVHMDTGLPIKIYFC